jgi:SH3 domain-containing YSC84-like protein 1
VRLSAREESDAAHGEKKVNCMKKAMTLVALLGLTSIGWAGTNRESTDNRMDHAGAVLHEIMSAPDRGIPEEVLEHAKCIAVVPDLLKGGFVFGAENGRGVATCRTANGWSAPAFFTITGGSWGLQIGVEGVDLVMIIQNDRGMQRLIGSKFQLGADASAAAGPVGRHASADTDWKMDTEILTYSRAKGEQPTPSICNSLRPSSRKLSKAAIAVAPASSANRSCNFPGFTPKSPGLDENVFLAANS